MNITFIQEPIPELTIAGGQLAALGFTTDTPIRLMLRDNTLSVTTVTDEAEWKELCEASQPAAAGSGGGLGTGERRSDYRRRLADWLRYHQGGTAEDYRCARCDPVAAAVSGRIQGLNAKIPAHFTVAGISFIGAQY